MALPIATSYHWGVYHIALFGMHIFKIVMVNRLYLSSDRCSMTSLFARHGESNIFLLWQLIGGV
jgi:hypothetical protein